MKVHAYASLPHYAEHIDAVWRHLPAELAGVRFSPVGRAWPGWQQTGRGRPPLAEPVIVAGYADATVMRPRPVILLEHGAGQAYTGDPRSARNGSYAGGDGLEHAVAFVCPSSTVADRWRARYPATPAAVVGCPKLDPWHAGERGPLALPFRERWPVVAVTFHWDAPIIPETRSAWSHYDRALEALRDDVRAAGGELLGHGHPRLWGAIERRWRALGVELVPRFADVLDRADVLVADNTSALYEFASTDRPVVVLNAPWYRRDVDHGLRFWSHVPGLMIDEPDELVGAVRAALADPPDLRAIRGRAVAHAYAHLDGSAGRRAATAVEEAVRHAQPVQAPAVRRLGD